MTTNIGKETLPQGVRRLTEFQEMAQLFNFGEKIICRMVSADRRQQFEPEVVGVRTDCDITLRHWGGDFQVRFQSPFIEWYYAGSLDIRQWHPLKSRPLEGWIRTDDVSVWARGVNGIELIVIREPVATDVSGPWRWTVRSKNRIQTQWDTEWKVEEDRATAEQKAIEYYARW